MWYFPLIKKQKLRIRNEGIISYSYLETNSIYFYNAARNNAIT